MEGIVGQSICVLRIEPDSAGTGLSEDNELGGVPFTADKVREDELGWRQNHVCVEWRGGRDQEIPAFIVAAAHAGNGNRGRGRHFQETLERRTQPWEQLSDESGNLTVPRNRQCHRRHG